LQLVKLIFSALGFFFARAFAGGAPSRVELPLQKHSIQRNASVCVQQGKRSSGDDAMVFRGHLGLASGVAWHLP
jgi:hypothetical protein